MCAEAHIPHLLQVEQLKVMNKEAALAYATHLERLKEEVAEAFQAFAHGVMAAGTLLDKLKGLGAETESRLGCVREVWWCALGSKHFRAAGTLPDKLKRLGQPTTSPFSCADEVWWCVLGPSVSGRL